MTLLIGFLPSSCMGLRILIGKHRALEHLDFFLNKGSLQPDTDIQDEK